MDLQDIDVGAQALDGRVHGVEDVFPRKTTLVYGFTGVVGGVDDLRADVVFVDAKEAFCEDDDFGAGNVVFFEGFADDAL